MKRLKLKKLKAWHDQYGDWVACADPAGHEWIVTPRVWEEFKYTGLPLLEPTIESRIYQRLNRRHYPALPREERYQLIRDLLELTTGAPIRDLFPNI